ncbi:MAG: hypothetical protein DMF49_03880 [Acidobacteria bacterium]|nr:MAG: hypothetical protein DMF49_03880 [Acidobacteriota bacterium]
MKHRGEILVCEDDPGLLALTRDILEADGHRVDVASSPRQALALLEERPYDLLLADMLLPGVSGIDLLLQVKQRWCETEVIIMTGHGDIDTAVRAIKEGAYDYVTKPLHAEKFAIDIQKALERKRLSEDLERLRRRTESRCSLGSLVGRSPAMLSLYGQIEQVAPASTTVIILGESGTGKEVTAREVHNHSSRRGGPFIAVSCATIPSTLLESELFGWTRGAFTGASASRAGLFEAADGGTLLLDEIVAATTRAQLGLLRVLQEREVRRIGSTESRKVDVRVIAATNADLEKAIEEGAFRTDLYYRLNGVTLRLPPLRERPEDIPLLAEHFLCRYHDKLRRPARTLSPRAQELLCGYHWPGNVRELEHVIERAAIFASREIVRPRDLPESIQHARSGFAAIGLGPLEDIERNHIRDVLLHTNGNKLKAARILRIPRASLYRRIEKYRLEVEPQSAAKI